MRTDVRRLVIRGGGMLLAVVAMAAAARHAAAADVPNLGFTLAGLRLGRHVSGPPCTPESLAHRPVLLEFWGIHCPPCLKSMPKLEELHRGLGPQGLVVIGAHAQDGTPDEIRAAVVDRGATFTIVEQTTVEGGMDFDGIPHCMLFDHTGACVYRGSPFEVHDAAVAVVKAAPGAVLQGRTLEKLTAFNELVRNERQFGIALKKAKGLTTSKNADMAAEAGFVVERLETRGKEMLDDADARKANDPLAAVETLQRCAIAFKGSEIGIDADKRLKEWKKDAEFRAAVKAAAMDRTASAR
ncbi:MAG: TlpA disulfide reductase family protein [Pirellulales bacterium]